MNLSAILEGHRDDAVALISRGRPTTYGTLASQVASMRRSLGEMGVGRGDVVALLCGNSRYFVVSYLAAVGIGAIVAPMNPSSPAPEIERECEAVRPVAVVIEPAATTAWQAMSAASTATVRVVIATEGHSVDGAHTIDDLLTGAPALIVDVEASHPAAYMFTSGTAGSPKAAILTHGNLRTNMDQATVGGLMSDGDVVFGVLPVFHIFGLNVMLCTSLYRGATVVLIQRFDPVSAIETIRDRHVTVIPGSPSLWSAFAQMPDLPADSFRTVTMAMSGAAKLPEQVSQTLATRFGLKVAEGYGLTEASPVVTSAVNHEWIPGSIGRAVKDVEVRLVDENGEDSLVGDAGEIWVRGANVFAGYLDDPEATARVLTPDGWLRTGDIAVIDDNGHFFIVDRAKDLIIVSGFNVYPAEVEAALTSHPDIAEASVVGTPHPHTGEAVRAYVVARDGVHLDEDAVIDFTRGKLARYKCPSKVLFVDSLPRNTVGKVQRYALQ